MGEGESTVGEHLPSILRSISQRGDQNTMNLKGRNRPPGVYPYTPGALPSSVLVLMAFSVLSPPLISVQQLPLTVTLTPSLLRARAAVCVVSVYLRTQDTSGLHPQ